MDVSLTTRSIAAVELGVPVDGGGCSLSEINTRKQ